MSDYLNIESRPSRLTSHPATRKPTMRLTEFMHGINLVRKILRLPTFTVMDKNGTNPARQESRPNTTHAPMMPGMWVQEICCT